MSFRLRLLVFISATVLITVGLVTWTASSGARRAFESVSAQHTASLVEQFRREFARRGEEVVRRVEGLAATDPVRRIAIETGRARPDYSPYVNEAPALAAAHGLDFVELVAGDGIIISSAQWPARFGYRQELVLEPQDWKAQGAFLKREELPDEVVLALVAVRTVAIRDRHLFILAGLRLGPEFVASLVLPEGMRALLFPILDPSALISVPAGQEAIASLVYEVRGTRRELTRTLALPGGEETFQAIPLFGREQNLLGVLLVGSSRRELSALLSRMRWEGFAVAGLGVALGLVLSFWTAARVTRPVERLAAGARAVAEGKWETCVDIRSGDEIEQLASVFNSMTRQLIEQRDRLVQTERVAAWRELARRLAHELKNPLFPLQITVENLQRAREQAPDEFDEVFRESTATLLAELGNLKAIIGRFSDFAKMPPPEKQALEVNELVRDAARLFEPQLKAEGRPAIQAEVDLDPKAGLIQADPDQLRRALRNLILNALDAMEAGGRLTLRTRKVERAVRLEVSDTGQGLTPEECARLFTPYYTTRRHGTGLGLAIVQSVVSDHKGRISVDSQPGRGATFRIELPEA